MAPFSEHAVLRMLIDEERALDLHFFGVNVIAPLRDNGFTASRPPAGHVPAACLRRLYFPDSHPEQVLRRPSHDNFVDWFFSRRNTQLVDEESCVLRSEPAPQGAHDNIRLLRPRLDAALPPAAFPSILRRRPLRELLEDAIDNPGVAQHLFPYRFCDLRPLLLRCPRVPRLDEDSDCLADVLFGQGRSIVRDHGEWEGERRNGHHRTSLSFRGSSPPCLDGRPLYPRLANIETPILPPSPCSSRAASFPLCCGMKGYEVSDRDEN